MAKLNDEELRALRTLARSPSGCAESVLMAHGFEVDQVANLVFRGLAPPDGAINDVPRFKPDELAELSSAWMRSDVAWTRPIFLAALSAAEAF
jgi:hypothetical protein